VRRLIASVRGRTINEEQKLGGLHSSGGDTGANTASQRPRATRTGIRVSFVTGCRRGPRTSQIEEALRQTAGNKQRAAQVLGLSRPGLIKKLKRLGM